MIKTSKGSFPSEVKAERQKKLLEELKRLPGRDNIEDDTIENLLKAFRMSKFMRSYGMMIHSVENNSVACLGGPFAYDFLNALIRDECRIDSGLLLREREKSFRVRFSTRISDTFAILDYTGDEPSTVFQSASWDETVDRLSSIEGERSAKRLKAGKEILSTYMLAIPSEKLDFDFVLGACWESAYSALVHIYVTSVRAPLPSYPFLVEPDHHAIVVSWDTDPGSVDVMQGMMASMLTKRYETMDIAPVECTIEQWMAECCRFFYVNPTAPALDDVKLSLSRFSEKVCIDDQEVVEARFAEHVLDACIPLMTLDHALSKQMGEDVWRERLRRIREECREESFSHARKTFGLLASREAKVREFLKQHPDSIQWIQDSGKAIHEHWHSTIIQTFIEAINRKLRAASGGKCPEGDIFPMWIVNNLSHDASTLITRAIQASKGDASAIESAPFIPETPRASAVSAKPLALALAKKIWEG
jgi:hypothetical protein